MIRIAINGLTCKMRHGLNNTTIRTREHGTLIQVHPNYESGYINKHFKNSFSTLTRYCTAIQRGHTYLNKPAQRPFYGRNAT